MAHNIWYTRRADVIRGPFPQGLITRYILIGRIQMSDELSADQVRWLPVKDFPEVIPEPMKGDPNDPETQEKLRIARRREDEREAGDRRARTAHAIAQELLDRRRKDDRREPETSDILQRRNVKTGLIRERKTLREDSRFGVLISIALGIVVAIYAGFQFMPKAPALRLQCEAPAGPEVNWSNCKFEGILLNNANLDHARLDNANLSGAQLRNTILTDAQLSYANFSRADLSGSDLRRAKLTGITLRNAVLTQANLGEAALAYAILQGADLRGVNLKNADLSKADLTGAMIDDANFDGANLVGAAWIDRSECRDGSVGKCVK